MIDFANFYGFDLLNWVLIPFMIFCARIIDVSIGTIRLVSISRGYKRVAPILGFFEVLIWIMVISNVMDGIANFMGYIAYAAGFATGTYVGMSIEERLAKGKVLLRIITKKETHAVAEDLKRHNLVFTTADAQGPQGHVKIILMVLNRQNVKQVMKIVKMTSPLAFYTVEDLRTSREEDILNQIPGKKKRISGLKK